MANGEFIGLNAAGVPKINEAIKNYIQKVNGFVLDPANFIQLTTYTRGTSSVKATDTLVMNSYDELRRNVYNKITELQKRIDALDSQYKSNDESQATTMNTRAKSILKS